MAADPNMTVEKARGLLTVCSKFAGTSAKFAEGQANALSDIMMAQDFQDLSGQVIKKVIDIINRTEMQLVHLLIDSAPESATAGVQEVLRGPATVDDHVLEGPQVSDKALQQSDVDDLLASLGF
jgi:chemotaxis protein CheZ